MYLMQVLCFEYRVVTVEYFLDQMQDYEVPLLLDGLKYLDRNQWEQSRLHYALLVNMFSKEKHSAMELIPMPWDDGYKEHEEHETEMSNEDRDRLQERAEKLARMIKETE